MNKDYWFVWQNKSPRPIAINRKGTLVVFTPPFLFVLFIISVPLSERFQTHQNLIVDFMFGLFSVSWIFKLYVLAKKTAPRSRA